MTDEAEIKRGYQMEARAIEREAAIIEAAALALPSFWDDDDRLGTARLVLAAVTPLIEAAALERAAKVAEEHPEYPGEVGMGDQIAAVIRALKQPAESSAA